MSLDTYAGDWSVRTFVVPAHPSLQLFDTKTKATFRVRWVHTRACGTDADSTTRIARSRPANVARLTSAFDRCVGVDVLADDTTSRLRDRFFEAALSFRGISARADAAVISPHQHLRRECCVNVAAGTTNIHPCHRVLVIAYDFVASFIHTCKKRNPCPLLPLLWSAGMTFCCSRGLHWLCTRTFGRHVCLSARGLVCRPTEHRWGARAKNAIWMCGDDVPDRACHLSLTPELRRNTHIG